MQNTSYTTMNPIPAIEWMITERCNYNCLHCPYAADNTSAIKEWTTKEAEKFLNEAQECGIHTISITGGEPLLHKYFFEIVEDVCRRNMTVSELNTNGQFISKNVLDWLKEIKCNPLIKISFDGTSRHDWLRNHTGSQQEALQTIHLCLENGFRVKAMTNIHKQNIDSILPTAELLDEMGVTEMSLICTVKTSRMAEYPDDICLTADRYYDYIPKFLEQYIESGHYMPIHIHQMLSLFPKLREYETALCRKKLLLDADGNLFLCQLEPDCCETEYKLLGNVKTEGLQAPLERGKDFFHAKNCLIFETEYYNRIKRLMSDWGYSARP